MPTVRRVMLYRFGTKSFENMLGFDEDTESSNEGNFSVTQSRSMSLAFLHHSMPN